MNSASWYHTCSTPLRGNTETHAAARQRLTWRGCPGTQACKLVSFVKYTIRYVYNTFHRPLGTPASRRAAGPTHRHSGTERRSTLEHGCMAARCGRPVGLPASYRATRLYAWVPPSASPRVRFAEQASIAYLLLLLSGQRGITLHHITPHLVPMSLRKTHGCKPTHVRRRRSRHRLISDRIHSRELRRDRRRRERRLRIDGGRMEYI